MDLMYHRHLLLDFLLVKPAPLAHQTQDLLITAFSFYLFHLILMKSLLLLNIEIWEPIGLKHTLYLALLTVNEL